MQLNTKQDYIYILQLMIFTLIINSNSFRILLGKTSSIINIVLFVIFFTFGCLNFIKKRRDVFKFNYWTFFYYILILYLMIISFLQGILFNNYKAGIFYFLVITTCLFLQEIKYKLKVKMIINLTIILNLISFGKLLLKQELGSNIGEFNYLNMTLSLGFALSIILSQILENNSDLKKKIIIFIILLFCQFSYPARGVIIYLVLIVLFYTIKFFRAFKLKKIFLIITILLSSYFIITKIEFSSTYNILSRFQSMTSFNELGGSRSDLIREYKKNINYSTIVFGNGVNMSYEILGMDNLSGVYPHNIFLEILADFGILPLLAFIVILIKILISYKDYDKNKKVLIVGFFYYIFQFSKSFSLYSSYMIWILVPIFLYDHEKS